MSTERWQSGPVAGVPPLLQPVAHALLQAGDDVAPAASLNEDRLWATPGGAAAIGWHLLHLAGSTDRLLTYARGVMLGEGQRARLGEEQQLPDPRPTGRELVARFHAVIEQGLAQLRATAESTLLERREVGRARIPSTVLGLLFHAAEHASRHAGQVVTTMKVVVAPAQESTMLIASVRTLLLRDLASFRHELQAYPSEPQIWATPPGVSNSTGTLALHCAGNLQHFIGARLGDTGYVRDRAAEFARRDVARDDLVAELGRAADAVGSTLDRLDPSLLETLHPDSFTGGKRVTVGLLLVHLAAHLTYHLGQADYHRRLVTGAGAIPGVVAVP